MDKEVTSFVMNPCIGKIGIFLKKHDLRVRSVVSEIIPWLRSRNVEIFIDKDSADHCPIVGVATAVELLSAQVDAIIVLGGDGTLLHATRLFGTNGVPIIGINLGSLGFLTDVKLEGMYAALECLLSGTYEIEERMLLSVEVVRDDEVVSQYLALNDAVINKGALARIIDIEVIVGTQPVLHTRADGLIIATPTGSTAYSLSAGGPILYPTLEAVIIAPICPHSLTNRPLVIPERQELEVCLHRGQDVMLTVDGQVGMPLLEKDCLRIHRAQKTLKLLLPFGNTFFKLLREKLRWG
jgi:NAD+ kinase